MTALADIKVLIRDEKAVEIALPGGGQVQIERPQPHICLYREGQLGGDAETRELVTGQSSYIVVPGGEEGCRAARQALSAAVEALSEVFGAVLVLELYTVPLPSDYDPEGGSPKADFELLAARQNAPVRAIEALQAGLLEQPWPGGEPRIRIAYQQHRAPKGLDALLSGELRERQEVSDLALGVRAIHRSKDGELLPLVLRDMRRSMTIALRQCFYAFSHARTRHRPAHYHELGAKEIEESSWQVDRALADVGDSFDLILASTPVNSRAAWHAFEKSRYEESPEFHYRPLQHDPAALKRQLYAVPLELVDDPALHALFSDKRVELDSQIDLLGNRCTKQYLYGSLQVYGEPHEGELELARSILSAISPREREKGGAGEMLDARAFAKMAQAELGHYREQCPGLAARVELRDDVPGILVSNGNFLIGNEIKISASRAAATIAHEVGTHILTFYNGKAQPFQQFHNGMAGYEATQEGIAVLAEYLVGGLSRGRLRLLAGRVLAVDALVDGADFVETHRMLHDHWEFSRRGAFNIAMRVHRSGGLTKDLIYLRGLTGLLKLLAETDTPFEDLFVGKFALEHLDLVSELKWRKILKPPELLPRYLLEESSRERLERARRGLTPIDLIESGQP